MRKLRIYTDGAFSFDRNQGGVGVVFVKEEDDGIDTVISEFSLAFRNTTNNRMEIKAITLALKCIVEPIDNVIIISDSMYAIGGSHIGFLKNKRNKNIDLFTELDKVVASKRSLIEDLEIAWVKGHYEDKYNARADELAVRASQEYINKDGFK